MSSPAFFRRPGLLAGLLATAVVFSFSLTVHAIEPVGFKPIFNGKDLSGWEGDVSYWSVKDGMIIGQSTEENPCTKNTFLQWTDGKLDDFELKLEFRLSGTEKANSGIQFRSQVEPDGHVVGYQADMDRSGKWLGGLYDERGRGSLAVRGQSTVVNGPKDMEKTAKWDGDKLAEKINLDGWNEYHIIARGNQLTLKINGETMCTVTDEDKANRDLEGVLALQLHSGPPMTIEFRNIQLKRLPLEGRKKVVFVAGSKSHGYFSHEHNAGCLLLAEKLNQTDLAVQTAVYLNGWPTDVTAFDNADTVVCYCDGGGRHFLNPHLEEFSEVMARGTGLVCLHYAVETVPGTEGEHFLKWLGGYFEPNWSVNPHWTADFKSLPKHPITRGVKPFSINDEWYYHMRFVDGMEGVTPILSAMPPRETLSRKDGPHSNNPHVREAVLVRKEEQHVGWAYERDNNGRAFGFTGGHWHVNWQHDQFRKVVLNAIAWTAHAEVPENGLQSPTPTEEEMKSNQDYPQPNNWKFAPPKTEVKQTATEKPAAQPVAKKKSLSLSTAAR